MQCLTIAARERSTQTMNETIQVRTLGRELTTQARAQAAVATQQLTLLLDVAGENLVLDVVELIGHRIGQLLHATGANVEQLGCKLDSGGSTHLPSHLQSQFI